MLCQAPNASHEGTDGQPDPNPLGMGRGPYILKHPEKCNGTGYMDSINETTTTTGITVVITAGSKPCGMLRR